jgi:hypothetical protein
VDWNADTIPTPWERFDENRLFRRFAERFTKPLDRGIEAVLEIYKRVSRPQPAADVFAGYQLPWMFQQHRKYLERLTLKPYCEPIAAQFTSAKIDFEAAEPNYLCCRAERQMQFTLGGIV